MSKYNYFEAVKEDVRDYIKGNVDFLEYETLDELGDALNETLWTVDSVTGNASGSYTFNAWEAEENVCHNLDLLGDALAEFGCGSDYLSENGAEAADVTIRCSLLGPAISEVLREIEDEFNEAHEEATHGNNNGIRGRRRPALSGRAAE